MDRMPELWQTPPKVHIRVVRNISARMLSSWTDDQIWDAVVESDISSEDDQIKTFWELRRIRKIRRNYTPTAA